MPTTPDDSTLESPPQPVSVNSPPMPLLSQPAPTPAPLLLDAPLLLPTVSPPPLDLFISSIVSLLPPLPANQTQPPPSSLADALSLAYASPHPSEAAHHKIVKISKLPERLGQCNTNYGSTNRVLEEECKAEVRDSSLHDSDGHDISNAMYNLGGINSGDRRHNYKCGTTSSDEEEDNTAYDLGGINSDDHRCYDRLGTASSTEDEDSNTTYDPGGINNGDCRHNYKCSTASNDKEDCTAMYDPGGIASSSNNNNNNTAYNPSGTKLRRDNTKDCGAANDYDPSSSMDHNIVYDPGGINNNNCDHHSRLDTTSNSSGSCITHKPSGISRDDTSGNANSLDISDCKLIYDPGGKRSISSR